MKFQRIAFIFALVAALTGCVEESQDDSATPIAPEESESQSTLTEVRSPSFGELRMFKHVPANLPQGAPLVVALHGCGQSASAYVATGWNDLADQWGFAVMYAEQPAGSKCFTWFELDETQRGKGEAGAIKNMIDRMVMDHGLDMSRVYVTGLSAGGGMTAVMLATYPDLFSAGAIMAGVPYHCATSSAQAFSCMFSARPLSQNEWAERVSSAYEGYPGPYPRVSIWQGEADFTVRPVNADALVAQWTGVHGISTEPTITADDTWWRQDVYLNDAGEAVVEHWSIDAMGHGTAIDPAAGCGREGDYVLDAGICSTLEAARFFGLEPADASASPWPTPSAGDAPSPTPEPSDDGVFQCEHIYASNYRHEREGRAYLCDGFVCAAGSDDLLGLWNVFSWTWVREVRPNYYEEGRCEVE